MDVSKEDVKRINVSAEKLTLIAQIYAVALTLRRNVKMNSRLISWIIAMITMITTTLFNIDIANSSPNSEQQLCIIPCLDEVIGSLEYHM